VSEPKNSAEEILRWTSSLPGEAQSGNAIKVLTSWDNNLSLEWRGPDGEIGRLVVVAVVENGHPVIKAKSFEGTDEAALKGEVMTWMTEMLHG